MRSIAFIPARSGSKRVPDKNIKLLNGVPLIGYSICAAIQSKVFDEVICVTDSEEYANIARNYGARVPALRPASISSDISSDIEWVEWVLDLLQAQNEIYDVFSILRPTNPFRLSGTIKRAWDLFISNPSADSLRAVQKCSQHPAKMWVLCGEYMQPILPYSNNKTPWHSMQYAALPEIYIQNASLEIAWTRVPRILGSIAGNAIVPFISQGMEGFDINCPEDWELAELYVRNKVVALPSTFMVMDKN